jgi:hypothetical protein
MKINYYKSDMMNVQLLDEDEIDNSARLFDYKIGSFLFKYLRVALHYSKLRREDIQPIMDKIVKRVAS